jgi:tRNA nucleotidyltransferase (CCA-adding enzyme)
MVIPTSNLGESIKTQLPSPLLTALTRAGEESFRLGTGLYLVGGTVRDLLLGRPSVDIDLVCEGDAPLLGKHLSAILSAPLTIHPQFRTVHLDLGNYSMDIASARRELYAKPGALPLVQPGNINDDLARRDFTINALAVSLAPQNYGTFMDPYGGRKDLDDRLIRVLHPGSFVDDPTRMWRAARYEQRLGFTIERETLRLLKSSPEMLDTLSPERVRHELELVLKENCPEQTLLRATELGILQKVNYRLKADDWLAIKYREVRSLPPPGWLETVYFCLLVYRLTDRDNEAVITRLNVPRRIAQAMRDTLRLKSALVTLNNPDVLPSYLYRTLKPFALQAVQSCLVAADSVEVRDNLYLFLTRLRRVKPLLGGDDLIGMGVSPGPDVGKLLDELQSARLDGRVKNRIDEIDLATTRITSLTTGKANSKLHPTDSSPAQS